MSNTGFIKYLNNSFWITLEKTFRILSGLLIGIWVSRYLKPENFGTLSFSQSISNLLLGIAALGLETLVIRNLVYKEIARKKVLIAAISLRIISTTLIITICSIVLGVNGFESKSEVLIMILLFQGFFQAFLPIDWYFQSQAKVKFTSIANIISLFFGAILKILFITFKLDVVYFASVFVVETMIYSFLLITFYNKNIEDFKLKDLTRLNLSVNKILLKDSWPLILAGLITTAYMRIDQIMIKYLLSDTQVGIYAVSTRISEIFNLIPIVLGTALFPAILNSRKKSKKLYYLRIETLITLVIYTAVIISIVVNIFSPYFIPFLYGIDYLDSVSPLKIHIWGSIFVFFGVICSKWIIAENLQRYSNLFLALGLIFNVILNSILIPRYELIGAAISTVLSQLFASVLFPYTIRKTRKQTFFFFNGLRVLRNIRNLKNLIEV